MVQASDRCKWPLIESASRLIHIVRGHPPGEANRDRGSAVGLSQWPGSGMPRWTPGAVRTRSCLRDHDAAIDDEAVVSPERGVGKGEIDIEGRGVFPTQIAILAKRDEEAAMAMNVD